MTVAGLESLGLIFNFGKTVQEAMPHKFIHHASRSWISNY